MSLNSCHSPLSSAAIALLVPESDGAVLVVVLAGAAVGGGGGAVGFCRFATGARGRFCRWTSGLEFASLLRATMRGTGLPVVGAELGAGEAMVGEVVVVVGVSTGRVETVLVEAMRRWRLEKTGQVSTFKGDEQPLARFA